MPREILRLPYPIAEIVLLEYPDERYGIEIYWRDGNYYEKFMEANSVELAQEAILRITERVLLSSPRF